jgi:F-box-like
MVRDQEQDIQTNVDAMVSEADTVLSPSSLLSVSGTWKVSSRLFTTSHHSCRTDELLVQILCYLRDSKDCSALSVTCRRLYNISKDPWTRSTYFIRYGKVRCYPPVTLQIVTDSFGGRSDH